MRHSAKKHFYVALLALAVFLLGAGCSANFLPQTPGAEARTASGGAPAALEPAPGYETLGHTYYTDENGTQREAFLPLCENPSLQPDSAAGSAHGVSVQVFSLNAASAEEALGFLAERFTAEAQELPALLSVQTGSPQSILQGTAGILRGALAVEQPDGTVRATYAVLYARAFADNACYELTQVALTPDAYDDTSEKLLGELSGVLCLNLPRFS